MDDDAEGGKDKKEKEAEMQPKNKITKEMVIGMHTINQGGRSFNASEIQFAQTWTSKVSAALERSELEQWVESAKKKDTSEGRQKDRCDED